MDSSFTCLILLFTFRIVIFCYKKKSELDRTEKSDREQTLEIQINLFLISQNADDVMKILIIEFNYYEDDDREEKKKSGK